MIESDCAAVVNPIKTRIVTRSHVSMIISNCVSLLKTLSDVRVELIRRSTNFAAHYLAREAGSFQGLYVWGLTPPDCIQASFALDLC